MAKMPEIKISILDLLPDRIRFEDTEIVFKCGTKIVERIIFHGLNTIKDVFSADGDCVKIMTGGNKCKLVLTVGKEYEIISVDDALGFNNDITKAIHKIS